MDFKLLNYPIPLRVATNGTTRFITGQGKMIFAGPNSTCIQLDGVLYCSFVTNTLISPVSLRLASFRIGYDTQRDAFLIYFWNQLWVTSTLNKNLRKWLFPAPLRPLSVSPFSPSPLSSVHSVHSFSPSCVSVPPIPVSNVVSTAAAPVTTVQTLFCVTVPVAHDNSAYERRHLTSTEKLLLRVHKNFGHVGLRTIRKMISQRCATGLPDCLPPGEIQCTSCMVSKSVNRNTLSSDQRTFNWMEAWNVDLVGPFETPALGGGLYILTMRDIGTGYAEIKILENKWEETKFVTDNLTRLETTTGQRVKILRSDNGGEFNNNVLLAWINSQGITPECSVAYHHYQNGTIEQYNRTLQDMGRTLLIDSGLPKNFWALAFVWACYTLNRIPNVASGNITPFKKMFLYAPNLDRLQSFGSQAFAHVPHKKRQKLDDWAVLGYVVYYLPSSKGWGFWVPSLNNYVKLAIATFPDYPSVIQPSDTFSFADILELQLGSFEDELTVQKQDVAVAEVAQFVPEIPEAVAPLTYKQAL
jgi:hypothetical protein